MFYGHMFLKQLFYFSKKIRSLRFLLFSGDLSFAKLYIKQSVNVVKTFPARVNPKLWMTTDVHMLLTAQDAGFRSEDKVSLCSVRSELTKELKAEKKNLCTEDSKPPL